MIPVCHYCHEGLSKEEILKNEREEIYQRRCDDCKEELEKKFPL